MYVEFRVEPSASIFRIRKIEIKQSRNRPGVAQRVPGVLSSQISMAFGI
jgi:hypothetical protein